MASSGMQAALYIRERQKIRVKKIRRDRFQLPSHVATKNIARFPEFPPTTWNKTAGASVAWPGPVGQTPDSELGTAPDGSILLPLPGDPQKKWTKKNKIHDALSFGDSSGDRRLYELQQGAAANTLLYVGLCSVALGLIISFVGTGEKGFKTVQLRFIGPGMIVIGVCCCAVRIMLCFCPAFCFKRRRHKGPSGKMAEFYKYMPFRNHPLAAAPATEAVPMTVLKPALKRTCDAAVTSTAPTTTANSQHLQKCQQSVMRPFPMATPEASLESSLEHLIEEDDHLYTKDEMDSKKNLSSLKSTITFEDSLNVGTEMMVKSFEELHDTSSLPGGSGGGGPATVDPQELVLSAANLPK
ncbi:uncharacterized protein LOC126832955 isoform X2 [Adelges cooleyi]|uniref:uncharacterized protein LOC126832955 isoform X2 n=1 Tax=Adelges cooleyi TaxID=133065 RepID=UPI00217FDD41|nr:uncharacterized protein LOC126832955 isoform X2 [Adelges cooleyi]XP_050419982.1 uncharacterized protein LOC126832955 isoform X2 [Adelges cooleyi]